MIPANSTMTRRFVLALALVFASVLGVYGVIYFLFEPLAFPVTISWSTSVVVFLMRRWRVEPPTYDAKLEEIHALIDLRPVVGQSFLPFGGMAMEPRALRQILSTIQIRGCETIVECGSGASTVAIARLLQQAGRGHLYSLEEDANWCSVMSGILATQGLTDVVTLLHAPLEEFPQTGTYWYDIEKVGLILSEAEHIDLLLVDGPKSIEKLSRYPALPAFRSRLDSHSMVVLDDSARGHETAVIECWKQTFPINVEQAVSTERGQAYINLLDRPDKPQLDN